MMTTAALMTQVDAYAAAVRNRLADLSPEQIEDLTDGLEADLAEALDDPARPSTGEIPVAARPDGTTPTEKISTGAGAGSWTALDLVARFGTPEAYADELRAAAGLPPELSIGQQRRRRRTPLAVLRAQLAPVTAAVTSHRRWPAVRDFLVSLRPAWWVARGWALFTVGSAMTGNAMVLVPGGLFGLVLLLLLVVASVQHGRGTWTVPTRFASLVSVLNAVAVVCLLVAVATQGGSDPVDEPQYVTATSPIADGVYLDGEQVGNLFVYGPDGEPVDGARIVDEDLRPVVLGGADGLYDPDSGETMYWEPREDAQGRAVWNAFPLPTWDGSDASWVDGEAVRPDGTEVVVPAPPVAQLSPLATTTPDDTPSTAPGGATSDAPTPDAPAPATPDAPAPAAPTAPSVDPAVPPVPDAGAPPVS